MARIAARDQNQLQGCHVSQQVARAPGTSATTESDQDAPRTREAIDAANRSRELAEGAVREQLAIWRAACEGAAVVAYRPGGRKLALAAGGVARGVPG